MTMFFLHCQKVVHCWITVARNPRRGECCCAEILFGIHLATVREGCWTRWAIVLIKHAVLMFLPSKDWKHLMLPGSNCQAARISEDRRLCYTALTIWPSNPVFSPLNASTSDCPMPETHTLRSAPPQWTESLERKMDFLCTTAENSACSHAAWGMQDFLAQLLCHQLQSFLRINKTTPYCAL